MLALHQPPAVDSEPTKPPTPAEKTGGTPLLLTASRAAAACSVSERTWRGWDVAGKIPSPIRIGRRTFWRPDELRAWVAAGCPDRIVWEASQD